MDTKASFKHFFSQKRYAQALVIATRYPQLQKTSTYKNLQKIFANRLQLAALYIKKGQTQKASAIVGEFARVENKKTLIRLMLEEKERFLEFVRYVSYGEVLQAYEISLQDPRYKKLDLYGVLIEQIERLLKRIEEAINEDKLEDLSLLESLSIYPKAKELIRRHALVQKLKNLFEKEELKNCYEFLDKNPVLLECTLGKRLEHHRQRSLRRAKAFAQKGEVEKLLRSLGIFLKVETKTKEVGTLLRKGIREYIKKLMRHRNFSEAEKQIYRYLELFGKDALFEGVMQEFEKQSKISLALMPEYEKKEERWVTLL